MYTILNVYHTKVIPYLMHRQQCNDTPYNTDYIYWCKFRHHNFFLCITLTRQFLFYFSPKIDKTCPRVCTSIFSGSLFLRKNHKKLISTYLKQIGDTFCYKNVTVTIFPVHHFDLSVTFLSFYCSPKIDTNCPGACTSIFSGSLTIYRKESLQAEQNIPNSGALRQVSGGEICYRLLIIPE